MRKMDREKQRLRLQKGKFYNKLMGEGTRSLLGVDRDDMDDVDVETPIWM